MKKAFHHSVILFLIVILIALVGVVIKQQSSIKALIIESKKVVADESIKNDYPDYLPKIVYNAAGLGEFTDSQKSILNEKLIQPYTDYYSMLSESDEALHDPVIAMIIKKKPTTNVEFQMYDVNAIHKRRTSYFSFLREKGQGDYEYWYPTCFWTDCREIPEDFRQKYPHILDLALGSYKED